MARSLLGMRYGSGQRGQAYAEWQNSGGEDEYNKALALKQSGNDRFNVRSLPGGTLGQSFIDSAVGVAGSLDDYAGGVTGIGDWANNYVQSQEMNMGQKPGASLSWDYFINGLPRDIGNVTGSMAGLALPVAIGTIAAPYLGVGATAAALGGAMVGAGLESMSEGGSKLRESLENGDSLDVAQDKANTVAGKNFALLAPTNLLGFGIGKKIVNGVKNAFKAGRTIKAAEAMANAPSRMSRLSDIAKGAGWAGAGVLNEGAQEAIQQGIQDSVEPDKEYGYLPWNWNDEQWSQFKDTLAPMAVLSATGGGARFGARKIGQWLGPEELAPDLDIDTAPSFNVPRTANYNISDEVSDRNLAQTTESKLRLLDQAYYDEYGEHLNVTSMKRHWGTNSKHESGSAFDVADAGLEGTPERRRFLEAKASEIGLKPLDEYENPSDGATGGHMHFSDDGTALNADTGFNGWSGNSDMDSLINTYAEQYGVDPALLAAVAEQESGFNQDAQSEAGAIGTMQLMPDTAKGLGVDPTDMAGNIEGGAKYLSQLMQQFGGDVHKALEAYNGGPGNVGIAQTMKYADEVLERYNKFAGKKAGTFSWKGSPAEVTTTEDYNKLFADNGFAKTDTATNFLENLRMFSQDVEQSKNKQVQQDSKKAEQALNSNDENIIQQTAESLGFNQQDKATAKQAKSPMPIQDITTHVKNNGWVEFGSKANADEFAKSDIAKGMERYSNTGFAVKGYNPYAAPKANAKQSQAPAKPTPEPAQSAQPQPSQSVSMLGEIVPPLPKEEQAHHQGAPLNRQEVGRLNSLMQNMPQNDQEKIQTLFSVKDYDGIRNMISDYTADDKINRNDIESAKKVAQILMKNPNAMQSAKGSARFSLSRLNDILANGSLSDINRMNNALATRLRENGEDPYKVIKAGKNTKVEPNLNDFLNTMSNKIVRRTHENTLNAKCKYKGQNMSKANRVEKMAANGERFEQRGKQFFGVTSKGDFKATMGEYHYYKYLTQREKETNAQTAPEQAKQKQDAKPVNKPAQQEEKTADTADKTLNRTSESKNIEQKTQAKQQDSNSMRKELIERAAANEDTWVNSKKSELHLEDDNDTVVKLTPQELKYYHDLIKKGVVGKPELYKKTPEDVGEMDDNVEMSKEQKQIYDENNGDRDMPNSDSEAIEQEENVNVKDKSDIALGDTVEVRTDDGKKIKAHYALIPADKLIASNKADDTLSKNEAYPQDLQPRDRQRTAMRLQVDSMANSLRPEDLADSRNPNQGAPIVRGDLTVLNGNGRTLAIQRAYQNGKAEEYTQYLMDNAEKLGLDKSQVAAMVKDEQPILVRVVDDLSEGDTQSVISSTTGGQRMGATEQAKSDAKKIKANTLRKYSEDNKGNDFLGDVLNDIVPANERNAYMTKDGKINKDGLARAERALFARAYGDESLMEDFGENLTEEARNMTNALKANAPAIAKLQQKIKDGNAHDIGLQKNLVEAVKAIKSAAEQNKPAQSIWEEQTMFEDTAYSPETIGIAKVLHDLRRSGRKLTAFIGKLADLNEQHGNPKDDSLFTDKELAEPSLLNDIPIANKYAEELTRAKYSRDAENQLDNQGEKAENEDEAETPEEIENGIFQTPPKAQAAFEKHLSDEYRKLTKELIAKQIGENVKDFGSLADPVEFDAAFSKLPAVKKIRVDFNMKSTQRDESQKNRCAVSYEYARRCFLNDPRVKRAIILEIYSNRKQSGVEISLRQGTSGRTGGKGNSVQSINSRTFATPGLGEFSKIHKQFTDLIGEKHSRDVSAFSFGENPLSEQALKAKAEFETPLDNLQEVSRNKLRRVEQNIQDFGKRIGVPVHFVRHPDKGYRGVCIHNGGIYINLNSNVPARRIFMHEFTHWLKASGEDNHKIFTALASVIETQQGTFNENRMNEYRKRLYGGEEMSDSQIIEEIVADAMSNSESAEQIMRAIERYNPDMNVSLWSKIKALWDKFCEAVGFKQNLLAHSQPELYSSEVEQTGKLHEGLNNREMAKFNATLNNLMRKIKDSEGNNVFTMDGTRLTIQGKPFEDVVKVQSVDDYRPTVRRLEPAMMFSRDKNTDVTDIKNNLNTANENLNKSLGGEITWTDELAYKLTRGAFGKTKKLDNLMVKTHKDMEYDRLVAQGKDPAMYKNVGWLQRYLTSPRRIANRVPLLMPIIKSAVRATERQERLRGEFNEGMNEIMRTLGWNESPLKRNDKKMRERQDKLQRILLAGDLGRTTFTVAQLREHGADRRVIKAYDLMRKLLDKAWEMANNIKEQNKYTTENFASEGMAEARLKDLQKENPFVEKVRTQSGANGEVVITFRTPNARKVANVHVSRAELDALKNNKNVHIYKEDPSSEFLEGMTPDTYRVSYFEKNPQMGKIKGYIPHLFNGYNLVVADKDGNVKFGKDGLPMVVSTHRSISEAVKEGSRLAEKNSKVNFMVQPQMNEFMGSAEQAAVLGDYSYSKVMSQIANGMNISLADAKKLTEGGLAMKSRGRFLGYTMQRKGVTGYEKNVYKATQMYFNQVARYVALDPFKRDAINYYNRTWGAFDDSKVTDRSINASFAKKYINDINGVPTGVEKALNDIAHNYFRVSEERASGRPALWVTQHIFTYPMTIAKLGILNMSSALLNLTQLVNLYGAMGEKTMSPEAYKRLLKQGFIGSAKAMHNKNSAEHKLLFDEMGLKYQIGIDVASGYSNTEVGGIAGLADKFNRLAGGSMYLFKQSDVFTKGVTMLTAYHKALAEGKSKEEAIEYAKEVNTKVNFDYSTADAPELFRALGPIGAVLLQFQKYPVKQLELFKDIFDDGRSQGLNRKRSLMRLAKYMTPYMAMSGIMGVPFVSLIGGIANLFGGDDFDWDEWIKQHMIEEFGEDSLITQSILYGGGAMFGFNVGSRVGVGDFGGISSQESTAAEMLAGKSTLLSTLMSMKRQIGYGNYVEALKSLSPSVGNIAIGLKGEVHTTRGRMKYKYQNTYERALRMIGFNPVNESLAGDLASIEYSQQNDEKHEKEKAVDAFIDEPTNENAQKLQELGVTPKTIQNEVARRTMNTHDLNKLKEQEKKEKEAKSKNKKKEKQYTASDYLKEMK